MDTKPLVEFTVAEALEIADKNASSYADVPSVSRTLAWAVRHPFARILAPWRIQQARETGRKEKERDQKRLQGAGRLPKKE